MGKDREICKFFKALTKDNRLKIVTRLRLGPQCVYEIEDALNLSQNLISHHLKKLEKAGMVLSEKRGTKVYYRLNKQQFEEHSSFLQRFLVNN